jgi:competence protein ComEC
MFLLENFYKEQSRFILWLPVFFMAGIFYYFSLHQEPLFSSVIIILSILTCLFLFFCRAKELLFILYPVIFFMGGFSIIFMKTHMLNTVMLKENMKDILIQGMVLEKEFIPDKQKYKLTIELDPKLKLPVEKVKLTYKSLDENTVDIGDFIEGSATLLAYSSPVSLFSYNFKRDAYFNGIGASGFLKNARTLHHAQDNFLKDLRYHLTCFLRENIKGQAGEIANALITGVKSGLLTNTRDIFAFSGLSHILAISGLHISLIAGIIFLFLRRGLVLYEPISRKYNIKKLASLMSIPAILFYVALSGYSYPAIRSFCMISIVFIGVVFDRFSVSMRSIALSAFFIMVFFPECAISISFQLSFAAVIGLIAFYESGQKYLYDFQQKYSNNLIGQATSYLLGIMATTVIATLSTTPISLYYFYQISVTAVLANMVAIPLTAFFIMPLALISVLSYFIYPIAIIFWSFEQSIWGLYYIALYVSQIKGSQILIQQPSVLYIGLFGLGFLWLCIFRTKFRYFGFIFIFCSLLTFFDQSHLPDAYVAEYGRNMAYKKDNILYVFNINETFSAEQWKREQGIDTILPAADTLVYFENILFIKDPWKWEDRSFKDIDCRDVFITNGHVKNCIKKSKIIIDQSNLKNMGAHFIWLRPFKILTTKDVLGIRPWS